MRLEEQMDNIDASIEKAKSQLNETSLLKQQLENQIELLKEQIHSAHMNDAHYDQRAQTVLAELENREEKPSGTFAGAGRDRRADEPSENAGR